MKRLNWGIKDNTICVRLISLKSAEYINTALHIVYPEEFDNISLRQKAQIANVSSGTPYVYYKDIQDLLTNLCYIFLQNVSGFRQILRFINTAKTAHGLKPWAVIFILQNGTQVLFSWTYIQSEPSIHMHRFWESSAFQAADICLPKVPQGYKIQSSAQWSAT